MLNGRQPGHFAVSRHMQGLVGVVHTWKGMRQVLDIFHWVVTNAISNFNGHASAQDSIKKPAHYNEPGLVAVCALKTAFGSTHA